MSVAPFTPAPGPDGSSALIERLSRPGVCCARITWGIPDESFIVPQNANRVYLAFSIVDMNHNVIVTPGETDNESGFVLSSGQPIIEFAGASLAPLVTMSWRGYPAHATSLNIIAINRDGER